MAPVVIEMTTNNTTVMDTELFQAATKGSIDILSRLLHGNSNVLNQMTPIKNTAMHIAAKHGHLEFVKHVHNQSPTCLTQANSMGDTPFHVASRAGHAEMVRLLISCSRKFSAPAVDVELGRTGRVELLRKGNNKGDTPMHDAVRNSRFDVMKLLIEEDPELLCLHNHTGESPLYVAVETGEVAIVKEIMQVSQCSPDGPNGRTAVHVAIIHKWPVIAELLLESKQELARVADHNKRSPLHFATTLAYSIFIQLILKYDTSTTYLSDKTGLTPIHIAALYGWTDIIKEFLRCCPDLKDLLDGQGRNILHLAIEGREVCLVKYILGKKEFEGTLNEKDNNGNTPLHLATVSFQPLTVNLLVRDERVDRMEVNNEGLSALAIAMAQDGERKKFETTLILVTLWHAARPTWCNKITSYRAIIGECILGKFSIEWYRDKAGVLMVVATLIATVSFAAGFTFPGGYNQDGANKGMAVLVQEDRFVHFVVFDIVCFCFSSVAVAFLIGVHFFDSILLTTLLFNFAQTLTTVALASLMETFLFGVGLTVTENSKIIDGLTKFGYSFYIVYASAIVTIMQPVLPFLYHFRSYVYFRSWLNQRALLDYKTQHSFKKRLECVSMLLCYKDDGQ